MASRRRSSWTTSRRASRRCGPRSASRTTSSSARRTAAHKAGVARAHQAHPRQQPGRLLREGVRGLVLRRAASCSSARTRSSTGKCVLHPTRDARVDAGAQLVLPAHASIREFLTRLFAERPEFLQPESRRNEMLALLDQGLEDISITRSRFSWARSLPRSRSSDRRAAGRRGSGSTRCRTTSRRPAIPDAGWRERWPAQLHVIGKDITRLHSDRLAGDAAGGGAAAAASASGRTASCCSAASDSASRPA